MKKFLLSVILTVCVSSFARGGDFELGVGFARPGALIRSESIDWRQSALAFASYKIPVVGGLSLGAQYTCLPATGSFEDLTLPGLYRSFTSLGHTFNLLAEYEFLRRRDFSPFFSIGCGPQVSAIRRFITDVAYGNWNLSWMTNYQVQFGAEFYSKVRVTVGHVQQNAAIYETSGNGIPAWYIALSIVL